MRLTCPNCLTEYDVPDVALTGRSRMLRCAYCGHQWRREAEGTADAAEAVAGAPLIDVPPLLPKPLEPLVARVTAAPAQRHPEIMARPGAASQLAPAKWRGWAPLIVLVLLVVALVAVLAAHRPIARAWPASAEVFQALGLK